MNLVKPRITHSMMFALAVIGLLWRCASASAGSLTNNGISEIRTASPTELVAVFTFTNEAARGIL